MKQEPLHVAIIVQGRIYAFEMAKGLQKLGIRVSLLTNYPKYIVSRLGLSCDSVESLLLHGVLGRLAGKAGFSQQPFYEAYLHSSFSRWASRRVAQNKPSIVIAFSGVAEELFQSLQNQQVLKVLVRASSHIEKQAEILTEESFRAGAPIEKPSCWMIEREKREYKLADKILVPSIFVEKSFLDKGFNQQQIMRSSLGVESNAFQADETVLCERVKRVLLGKPLHILTVGTFSFRKGALDYFNVVDKIFPRCHFRFVGSINQEATAFKRQLGNRVEWIGKIKEKDLREHYSWGDLFLFPTIEDGFAVVLTQALNAGLPVITSENCGGPDVIREGENGWVVPIRKPEQLVSILEQCDEKRESLANMVQKTQTRSPSFSWKQYENFFLNYMDDKQRQ